MASAAVNAVWVTQEQVSLSLDLPKDQTFDQWTEQGKTLASANQCLNWWIGDWWAAGSHRYGARAEMAAEGIFGREFGGLMNMASVCRAFSTSRRREVLSFSHHQEVAGLAPSQADRLLDRAEEEGWSTRELRTAVSGQRRAQETQALETYPIREKTPSIAHQIEQEAERIGERLPDFLATLITIGWRQYQTEQSANVSER